MKRIVLLIALLIGLNTLSQNIEEFKSGVKIVEIEKIAEYKSPKSILFIFEGNPHSINYFLDLRKRIRKTFKRTLRGNFKHYKLSFNYNLNAKNVRKPDLDKIPSKIFEKSEYESICYVNISDFKGWDNHLIEKRKQNYNLNIRLVNKNSKDLVTLKLNVSSYFTILTENNKSSKLICESILGK